MGDAPDQGKIERNTARIAASLDWFESLLEGRDYLFGVSAMRAKREVWQRD